MKATTFKNRAEANLAEVAIRFTVGIASKQTL